MRETSEGDDEEASQWSDRQRNDDEDRGSGTQSPSPANSECKTISLQNDGETAVACSLGAENMRRRKERRSKPQQTLHEDETSERRSKLHPIQIYGKSSSERMHGIQTTASPTAFST